MLIEDSAYSNRWRHVSPAAKGLFSICGIVAAYAAATPASACGVALIVCSVTVLGAGVPLRRYLFVAAPALLFLLVSALSLAVSFNSGNRVGDLPLHLHQTGYPQIAQVCGRSLGGLTSLLFLAMTTPLSDIITLLRRFRTPGVLLDIMILCYRTLFVLSETVRETITAQSARLGYATTRLSMRSLGTLVSNITVQVWQRSQALHIAAMARNNNGPLRFLEQVYANSKRDILLAFIGGATLVGVAVKIL